MKEITCFATQASVDRALRHAELELPVGGRGGRTIRNQRELVETREEVPVSCP